MDETPKRVRGPSFRPLPADFALHASVEGDLKLKARYHVGRAVILRWRLETGIYCGAARGPRVSNRTRHASRSTARRQKPYSRPAMSESISWFDGDDDLSDIIGLRFDRDEW